MKTLYFNGDFIPMTGEDDGFEALLVAEDGSIAFTGTLEEARKIAFGAAEVDLAGKTMMPGFVDAHSHFSGTTQYILTADLSQCTSFADVQAELRNYVEKRKVTEDGVVMGTGYDQNNLDEKRHPDKMVLDEVSATIPIFIMHASSHMGVGNTKMLELANITEETPDPTGGRFGRVGDTQEPDGYAEEPSAFFSFTAVTQPRMNMNLPAMVGEMQDYYLEHGITTCQDGATQPDFADMFCALAQQGAFKLDLVGYPMEGTNVEETLAKHADFESQDYTGRFRLGGVKMFLDGSPQGRTAWMTEPYEFSGINEPGYTGYGTMTDEAALAYAKAAVDNNRQLLAHANGDAAGDQLLRVYEQAVNESDNPNARNLRPVMIHCQTMRRDQYEKMAAINMIPSIFVDHVWYWGDIHLKNFGSERANRISAVKDALDLGLHYTFHNDTPVLHPNLLEAVWCAVNRLTKGGLQLGADQAVGVYDALKAITIQGAYQYGEEDRKGTLEAGKLADLVILEKNPLKVSERDIRDIKVLETIKEGDSIWKR
ncbi:MAG: amidohydrolase [Raoultibacter sp.]